MMTTETPKRKIAVLGGGISALTAVFEITNQSDWQDHYEITVYQMGWRLGGKGASGRNMGNSQRIEEHGLHVWFGFYENAFNLMYRCYEELGRSPRAPLPDLTKAFTPQNYTVFQECIDGNWIPWKIDFKDFSPKKEEFPGTPVNPLHPDQLDELPGMWHHVVTILHLMSEHLKVHPLVTNAAQSDQPSMTEQPKPHWWERIVDWLDEITETAFVGTGLECLEYAHRLAKRLEKDVFKHDSQHHDMICWLLEDFRSWFKNKTQAEWGTNAELRHLWILVDLGITAIVGILDDNVLFNGYCSIDDLDFREWLAKHHASDEAINSVLIRAMYDVFFAYDEGDTQKPNVAAGAALRGIMRTLFTYRGAVLYKMNAGMGDTIFAPMYQVLSRRGVKFEFFNQVKELKLSEDKQQIAEIIIRKQVTLTVGEYDPLIVVKGLRCWPSTPLDHQILEADQLRESSVNLESHWSGWAGVNDVTLSLEKGEFTDVILGTSLGTLPYLCKELEINPRWKKMVEQLQAVQTQAVQLWFKPNLQEMGWPLPSAMVATCPQDYSSWSDFSHLIPSENSATHVSSQLIAYSCGVLLHDHETPPPPETLDYPLQRLEQVKANAKKWLNENCHLLWPNALVSKGEFKWETLVAPETFEGEDRFEAQYCRANIDPSELYELTQKGKTKQVRMKTDESGFSNLYLVGTWIDNNYYLGCIEGAVMSGKMAARAICGYPETIVGEDDV